MDRFETLIADDSLHIRFMPGRQKRLVVVFGGAKIRKDGTPRNEFIGTTSQNGRNPVLYVQDLNITWYSHPGIVERIAAVTKQVAAEIGAEEIVALGNSMGGFGAILLARDVPVARSLAFVPQISMDPDVIDEPRFDEFRPAFGPVQAERNVGDVIPGADTQFTVIFGRGSDYDNAQAALLTPAPNLRLSHVCRSGHNTAEWIKKHGLLAPLIGSFINGFQKKFTRVLNDVEERLGKPGWHKLPDSTAA